MKCRGTPKTKQEKGEMVDAMKALSQATISQTLRHCLYKQKFLKAKDAMEKESARIKQVELEMEEAKTKFYEARAKLLKERDIRDELSEEVQYLAKKNNKIRKQQQKQIDDKQLILDQIKETWNDARFARCSVHSEPCEKSLGIENESDNVSIDVSSGHEGESTHEKESTFIKELEKKISQLSLHLEKKDEQLNLIRSHLQGESNDHKSQ